MSKALYAVLAAAMLTAALAAPASAAIICDEDGCRPAVIIPTPILIGDGCGCDD